MGRVRELVPDSKAERNGIELPGASDWEFSLRTGGKGKAGVEAASDSGVVLNSEVGLEAAVASEAEEGNSSIDLLGMSCGGVVSLPGMSVGAAELSKIWLDTTGAGCIWELEDAAAESCHRDSW